MAVYRRIRDLREDHDLTQKDVANALYMHVTQYRRYETGERVIPLEVAVSIANFYNVTVDYIAETSDSKKVYENVALSELEAELVSDFRKLSPVDKGRVLERMKFFLK